jgi:hypothetical protein
MSHKARVVEVRSVDGILAVRARCCQDPSSDRVLSLHRLERANEELDLDVQKHLADLEKAHADRARAQEHIERLMEK